MPYCNICGQPDFMRCNCEAQQPYCDQCAENTTCTDELDADCLIYHKDTDSPSLLINTGLPNKSKGSVIFEALDALVGGIGGGGAGRLLSVSVFALNGTWTKPAGCTAIIVQTIGAGGGSGGIASLTVAQTAVSGGGGAGGNSIIYVKNSVNPIGATEAVVVGVGGAAGNAGNSYIGQDGGNSSFGAFSLVGGGKGGGTMVSGTTAAFSLGGNGGTSTIVDATWFISGGSGEIGGYGIRLSGTVAHIGQGGSSVAGGSEVVSGVGDIITPGAGGNGVVGSVGSNVTGGVGDSGRVIVWAFS